MDDTFRPILVHYIDSTSMLQKFLAAIISECWAREYDARSPAGAPLLIEASPLAAELATKTLAWLQAEPPASYHEMAFTLARIHGECYNLLQSFAYDCKLPQAAIPALGTEIDVTGTREGCFTIDTAQAAVGAMFDRLKESLGRTKKREVAIIKDKRLKVVSSIDRYIEVKAQYDVRVAAAFAAAFVAFRGTPDKVSPIVKGIMNSIKVSTTPFRPLPRAYARPLAERGEPLPPDALCCSGSRVRRVLRAARPLTASRQDRQEPLHVPLPGR